MSTKPEKTMPTTEKQMPNTENLTPNQKNLTPNQKIVEEIGNVLVDLAKTSAVGCLVVEHKKEISDLFIVGDKGITVRDAYEEEFKKHYETTVDAILKITNIKLG